MGSTQNIRLIVEYDGSRYQGWQWQPFAPTVQGELLGALGQVINERPNLAVAGRTDAGVHAMGQVVSFKTASTLEARRLAPALNHFLPTDISVHRSEAVDPEFDARHDSTSKRYRYRVYLGPQPAALELGRAWQVRRKLHVEAMAEAAKYLEGHLDFEAFRSSQCDAAHARRNMFNVTVQTYPRPPLGSYVDITYWANAFCRHMCRILSGTLVDVGREALKPKDMQRILLSRDRTQAGMTAPPEGLTLLEVLYPSG